MVTAADKATAEQAEADPSSKDAAYFDYDGKPGIDKTDIAEFDKRYKEKIDPPRRAPANSGANHPSPEHRPAGIIPETPGGTRRGHNKKSLIMAAIGALASRKEHLR